MYIHLCFVVVENTYHSWHSLDTGFNLEGIDLNKQDVDIVFETNSHIPVAFSVEIQLLSRKVDKVK